MMKFRSIRSIFSVAVVVVFTVGLISGCGQQDSATADQSQPEQTSEEMSSEHDDHDDDHDSHDDEEHSEQEDHGPDHYQGEKSESWEEAVAHLRENNQKLSNLLEKDELTEYEMEQVHELTYTLEDAIGHIREELDETAESLEEVHLASEEREADTVRKNAERYLESSDRLTK